MNRIRSFVAARLPEEVREDLARAQVWLRSRGVDARWVARSSMHLTLKFLGELEADVFDGVGETLCPSFEIRGPLRLEVRGLGGFPSGNRARVVWASLGGDTAPLVRIAFEVESRVEALGIPREGRPFQPHLTLGRAKGPSGIPGLANALTEEPEYHGPPFEVGELVLYESRLRPQGPLYIPRLTIPLT